MRNALGRGLSKIISDTGGKTVSAGVDTRSIPLEAIKPNHLQPRKNMDAEKLSELTQSIRVHGLAQPIVVSYDSSSNNYELIAGERRFRACQLAGLSHIDAVIRNPKDDKERLALTVTENIQREDFNAIDTARAYRKFIDSYGVSRELLSQFLGKSKSAISNTLRLLDLPEEIQKAVESDQLAEGHARALLMVEDPFQRNRLFKMTVDKKLSVRDVEGIAQQISKGKKLPEAGVNKAPKGKPPKPADVKAMENELEQTLGTRVEIRTKADMKSGKIVIHFYDLDSFDSILRRISK
ncbi:MAG: ParB/RepB/Spo0J family partition protein [Candidatus Brocadiia bacterium]